MNFRVQSSVPKNTKIYCNDDEKLSEAIETIFPMMTEEAFLVWNTIYIPLNYKYDVSYMIEDILNILKYLRKETKGEMKIDWASNTFACEWFLTWDEKMLRIEAEWRSVLGHIEELLNKSNELNIEKELFMNEWKKLLEVLLENLRQCGYSAKNLIGMDRLIEEYNFIKNYGLLYEEIK